MDSYKESYATYELAVSIAEGRGVVYKCKHTGQYKITTKVNWHGFYNRAKEKAKTRALVTNSLSH